jgi:hypothetical protein
MRAATPAIASSGTASSATFAPATAPASRTSRLGIPRAAQRAWSVVPARPGPTTTTCGGLSRPSRT